MNLHHLAEERSLAYHAAIAARLELEPALLDVARHRVEKWLREGNPHAYYTHAWSEILSAPLPIIRQHLVDPSSRCRSLRQVTPFAGLVDARERWKLWREVRTRCAVDR